MPTKKVSSSLPLQSDPSFYRVFQPTTNINLHKGLRPRAPNDRKLLIKSLHVPSRASLGHGSSREQKEKRKVDESRDDLGSSIPPEKKPRLDADSFLKDLRQCLRTAVDAFRDHPSIPSLPWYRHLRIHLAAVQTFKGPVTPELFDDPAITMPYIIPDLSIFESEPQVRDRIKSYFTQIESLRKDILVEDPAYSHSDLPFPQIEFVCMVFYYYALLRAYVPSSKLAVQRDVDPDFVKAVDAASRLIAQIPDLYAAEDDSPEMLRVILDTICPGGGDYHWSVHTEDVSEQTTALVYSHYSLKYPLLIAEIKKNTTKGGEPFTVGNRIYSKFFGEPKTKMLGEKCGAPALFIEMAGMFDACALAHFVWLMFLRAKYVLWWRCI